ncbi:MAG: STAS domain-containing protein [candidate division KSB1 bacterium]|nr:STAS domain-containing protein [candidate division KSB1 bacterium]MDZ7276297.1 STAS domain-containing protein [candidate division KSB1 bacterium]MDZ7287750.1 STAS domain-containing protein [candidate division KSB1 bacterium]MDZ7299910.1 STAS domain-containing protein [candidate division KSB1 bacterium]MDZ7350909.1 STAS domain-containing protein [candidate division KSB1 bacterium]
MSFIEENRGPITIFHLQGKIMGDPETQMMCTRLKDMIAGGVNCLVMDFGQVQWINSSGIGAIIACLTALRDHGGDIRFANLHHMTQRYFHLTRLETVVQTYPSVEEAVASFAYQPSSAENQPVAATMH